MFRMLIYWECLLLWFKCIYTVKLCLCRKCNSFYSLVPIENAFWCNLSAFTFSSSLPLNECLWITFLASLSLFLSSCVHTLQFLVCPYVQEKKKFQWNSSFIDSSSTSQKTKQAICLKQSLPACPREKK